MALFGTRAIFRPVWPLVYIARYRLHSLAERYTVRLIIQFATTSALVRSISKTPLGFILLSAELLPDLEPAWQKLWSLVRHQTTESSESALGRGVVCLIGQQQK